MTRWNFLGGCSIPPVGIGIGIGQGWGESERQLRGRTIIAIPTGKNQRGHRRRGGQTYAHTRMEVGIVHWPNHTADATEGPTEEGGGSIRVILDAVPPTTTAHSRGLTPGHWPSDEFHNPRLAFFWGGKGGWGWWWQWFAREGQLRWNNDNHQWLQWPWEAQCWRTRDPEYCRNQAAMEMAPRNISSPPPRPAVDWHHSREEVCGSKTLLSLSNVLVNDDDGANDNGWFRMIVPPLINKQCNASFRQIDAMRKIHFTWRNHRLPSPPRINLEKRMLPSPTRINLEEP